MSPLEKGPQSSIDGQLKRVTIVDLAHKFQPLAASLPDEVQIRHLVPYLIKGKGEPDLTTWIELVSSLDPVEKSQLSAALGAVSRSGIRTIGELRQTEIGTLMKTPTLGNRRALFLKTIFNQR